ncbi:hypothetical protein C1Y11_24855, partial [Pseudomonas sp. FW305-20]
DSCGAFCRVALRLGSSNGLIVPTLRVGMPQGTLRVPALERDAERPGLHSHGDRGNDHCVS